MKSLTPALMALLSLVLAAGSALAQSSSQLLVVDADAGAVSTTNAGALLNVNLTATSVTALPTSEASAAQGAPFEFLAGAAISPLDGRAYFADWGVDQPPNPPIPRIYSVDGRTGAVQVIAQGAPLVQPLALTFLPDGRLVVADWEADPASLGNDDFGGVGHGALFVIDVPNCGTPPCSVSTLSDGRLHPFGPAVNTTFEDPVGVAYDKFLNVLYVVDLNSPSAVGLPSSVYSVNITTGRVTLTAANDAWTALVAVDVLPDGSPVVTDTGIAVGDSSVWKIDTAGTYDANATEVTGGTQYSYIEDTAVDPQSGRLYIVDSGEYDPATSTFIAPPRIFGVDPADPNPGTNAQLINESSALVNPIAGVFVPRPIASGVSPSLISAPTNVIISGENLFPWTTLNFGPRIAVSSVDWDPGQTHGLGLQAVLTPTSQAIVPQGCGASAGADLDTTNPFDSIATLVAAVQVKGGNGGITPQLPASAKGDATNDADGLVDGLDLAILGRAFGAVYCDGLTFANNADFNNDDVIDGGDLAILATWFGTRTRP